jgi:hypothetical protein
MPREEANHHSISADTAPPSNAQQPGSVKSEAGLFNPEQSCAASVESNSTYRLRRRRTATASPSIPVPRRNIEPGSGTAAALPLVPSSPVGPPVVVSTGPWQPLGASVHDGVSTKDGISTKDGGVTKNGVGSELSVVVKLDGSVVAVCAEVAETPPFFPDE